MKIRFKEYGDKNQDVIIFIHGGGVSDWMWDKQIAYFTCYHCLVPILQEHGIYSDSIPFSIKKSAEQIISLIEEKAHNKKITLIGFSLGAQIIIQILSMRPNLIHDAVINSALVQNMPLAKRFIKPIISLSFPLMKNKHFAKLQAKTLYIPEELFQQYYEESLHLKRETLIRVLEENMSFQIPKNFHNVQAKMLITVGEKEKPIMKKSAIQLVKANKNCQGLIFANIGHGIPLAKPDYFNQIIEAWMNERHLPQDCKIIQ